MGRTAALALAAGLALAAVAGCGGSGTDLTYRWKEGDVLVERHVFETHGGTMAGSSGRLRTELTLRETVLRVTSEGARVKVAVDRIRVEAQPDGRPAVAWDSKDPPTDPTKTPTMVKSLAVMGLLVGEEFEMRCRPTGDAEAFDGVDSLMERVRGRLPAGDPRGMVIGQFLQPANLRFQVAPLVRVPAAPMSVGAEWDYNEVRILPAERTGGINAFLYCQGKGRLVEVKDGRTRIEVKGTVSLDTPPGAPEPNEQMKAARALLNLKSGTFESFLVSDTATGTLVESEVKLVLDLTLTKLGGEGETDLSTTILNRIETAK